MASLTPATDPWPLLGRVSSFTLQVFDPVAGDPIHAGAGVVRLEPDRTMPDRQLVWHETGCWQRGPLAGMSFRTSTRWTRAPGEEVLGLSHLRRGAHRPTPLVELHPGPGEWRSIRPHRCGADRYTARLSWDPRVLRLEWTVESPTDPYRLEWCGHLG